MVMEHRFWLSIMFMVALSLAHLADATLRFGMFPKGVLIPSFGSSTHSTLSLMTPISSLLSKSSNFRILPTSVSILPSGPSGSTSDPPPLPLISTFSSLLKSSNFKILPTGVPIPLSRPSGSTSDPPPPPSISTSSSLLKSSYFRILPTSVPIPPPGLEPGPSGSTSDPPPPPLISTSLLKSSNFKITLQEFRAFDRCNASIQDAAAPSTYPPFPPMILASLSLSKSLKFGMLPKGVPIPPSGLSRRTSDLPPPPPPLTSTSLSISKSLNFGILPKGPPSPGKM
ncbi:hypothetical protein CXB51_022851 [Gossypium anomalum]|uniref:Uncharacterized protein n=1 Tax=Gossypium anomalum TaxID=47600 RepID=A0A8J5YTL7_9ROSI|nr:hypothetical protein CXB51_022851 [Gossypium anomalum]